MADPAGVTFGVLGLAGAFADAVKCFQYVKLGKNFANDYKTSIIQLELLGLQLSRWGEAIGFNTVDNDDSSLTVVCDDKQKRLVQETLAHVCDLFKRAEENSKKITGAEVDEQQQEMENIPLRDLLQKLSLERVPKEKRASLSKKARWALHRRETFTALIQNLQTLVRQLIELIPPPLNALAAACHHELEEVANVEQDHVKVMEDWAKDNDEVLKEAIKQFSATQSSVTYTNTFGDSNKVAQTGNIYGTHNVSFGG